MDLQTTLNGLTWALDSDCDQQNNFRIYRLAIKPGKGKSPFGKSPRNSILRGLELVETPSPQLQYCWLMITSQQLWSVGEYLPNIHMNKSIQIHDFNDVVRVVLLTHSLISIGSHGVITIIGVMAGRSLGASTRLERSAEGVDGPWITGGSPRWGLSHGGWYHQLAGWCQPGLVIQKTMKNHRAING